ncbi:lipoic acid synthetase [Thermaerobacter marianensis DSM 12885]|uniref:Lipoyl synthase n=1 Tax=Thermaerobacter marianensis (strain ATCC 700841 / DSM 12885 / JCM 10246 / 7p75a) TaxID=644966 RepID=E6SHH9_THEM7|nr:lipoyl synthase [Thermaerobacter marianensis]ADU51774.1 lipoic acid synthetase [Thermaerobacter marianensis DSM 12885]
MEAWNQSIAATVAGDAGPGPAAAGSSGPGSAGSTATETPGFTTAGGANGKSRGGSGGVPGRGGDPAATAPTGRRHPDWLKVRLAQGPNYNRLKRLLRGMSLHTVCEEARCPNIYECFENLTATFMILGNICTRACRFCAVTTGRPTELDWAEPERVADAVERLGLQHVVVTSVARDDLRDGGAIIFAETVRAIRRRCPDTAVEVLIPDFNGDWDALQVVLDAEPDILNHNVETVRRLSDKVRSRATYDRSLALLAESKRRAPHIKTKSGLMLGLGETWDEILETLRDLRAHQVDIVTIGQYLRPTRDPIHLPVEKYYHPDEFAELKRIGLALGFAHVESGPLVRSSYHAHEQADRARARQGGAVPAAVDATVAAAAGAGETSASGPAVIGVAGGRATGAVGGAAGA